LIIRQSTLKTWSDCQLKYFWQNEKKAPREQSSALSWGTTIHEAVLAMEVAGDLQVGLNRFCEIWDNLENHGLEYAYILPRNSHLGYRELGINALRNWWGLIQWESDIILGREYPFSVPLGDHTLTGTIDKLALRQLKHGEWVVLVSDYKTNSKAPTRDYLAHDIQFSAYAYATTRPEFWANIPDGDEIFRQHVGSRRFGEWVHLRTTKRIDAGVREQYHYNRLQYLVNNMDLSISMGIYSPTLTGASCEYCEYRLVCGLPSREEEGLE
jgi:hypothetical protein